MHAPRPRRFSAHLGYLFTEHPLADRVMAARKAGFDAVEHPNPYAAFPAEWSTWLKDAGLPFAQMALPSGDASRGDKGLAALPERRAEFVATIEPSLDYAQAIGCRRVHAMAGLVPPHADRARIWDTYLDNIGRLADAAAARAMVVLIEAIGPGTIADYFVADAATALRAANLVARPNVRLLLDVFHARNGGENPVEFIRTYAERIEHLHIADLPGRHEPGTGSIDFARVYEALDEVGYDGLIGCEYVPAGKTEDGLGWLAGARRTA